MNVELENLSGDPPHPMNAISGRKSTKSLSQAQRKLRNPRLRWIASVNRNLNESDIEAVTDREFHNYEFLDNGLAFMLGGRLVSTKEKPFNVLVFALIMIPCGLYFGFTYVRTIF
jgi:hypothetical protein